MSKTAYPSVGNDQMIMLVDKNGAYVSLDDGSAWMVAPFDTFKSMMWLPGSAVSVTDSMDSSYPYFLTCQDDAEAVMAKLTSGKANIHSTD